MAKRAELFAADELEAIAKALGNTFEGLTGSEIQHILQLAKLRDVDPEATKWKRIHNAFVHYQNREQSRASILAFIRKAMKPTRYRDKQEHYETMRHNLNGALSFCGLSVQEDGALDSVKKAKTLKEAEQRADTLRASLKRRDVHPDVLKFCKAELLTENFFHAVLEATKSVAEKIREKTGLRDDGASVPSQMMFTKRGSDSGAVDSVTLHSITSWPSLTVQKILSNRTRDFFTLTNDRTISKRWLIPSTVISK